jgi:two-component system chemotaxis response regulator CheB
VKVDHCLPLDEIAPLLVRLTAEAAEEEGAFQVPKEVEIEVNIAKEQRALDAGVLTLGEPSNYACPDCHGVLLRLKAEGPMRFRCHTGHAYSADSLLSELTESVEETMWSAIRSIDESAMLMRHMAEHVRESDNGASERFLEKARDAERRGELVRQAVFDHENLSEKKVAEIADTA